jgi:proteasome lid subunit RPN8/RPN11
VSKSRTLSVEAVARESMLAHAVATYPDECCGALIGRAADGLVLEALALPNSTQEGARRRFLVTPRDYSRSERHAASCRLDLLGFYHSHPDHPAVPSQHDLGQAWPNFHYVILSVREGRVADLRSWQLTGDRSGFDEDTLTDVTSAPLGPPALQA